MLLIINFDFLQYLETFQKTGVSGRSSTVDSDDDSPAEIGSLASSDSDGDAGSKSAPRQVYNVDHLYCPDKLYTGLSSHF